MTQDTTPATSIKPRVLFAALLVVAIGTRALGLATDSLWMDEILLWGSARELSLPGLRATSHPLTNILMALMLQLGDSPLWVRLPSALFGTATALIGAWWAWKRLSLLHAACVGGLLALAPFAIWYSQDAGHYAPLMLAGLLAVVSVDGLLADMSAPRYRLFALAALACFAAPGFHPVGLMPAAALLFVTAAWVFANPTRVGVPERHRDWGRLGVILIVGGLAAVVAPIVWQRMADASGFTGREDVPFSWTPRFWSRALGDFFGACYHSGPIDRVLGIMGAVGALAGLVVLARRGRPWAVAGPLLVFALVVLPFTVFSFNHYFSPRYIIALLPVLLVGAGVACGEAIAGLALAPARRALAVLACMWLGLFVVQSVRWNAWRLGGEHQQSLRALEWIARETPPDARVFTQLHYTSRAVRFLWRAHPPGTREHHATSYIRYFPSPTIHQLEEAMHRDTRPAYFMTFSDFELRESEDLHRWLQAYGRPVAFLPSGTPREPWPIDRNIRIWQLVAPARNPSALPRAGEAVSSLLGEEHLHRSGLPGIGLRARTSGAWNIETEDAVEGLLLNIWIAPREENARVWLLGSLDDERYFLWEIERTDSYVGHTLAFEEPIAPGRHRLELCVLAHGALGNAELAPLVGVEWLDLLRGDRPTEAHTGTPLDRLAADFGEAVRLDVRPDEHGPVRVDRATVDSAPASAEWWIVARRVRVGGLGDREVWMRARTPRGTSSIVAAVERTRDWVLAAGIFPAVAAGEVTLETELRPVYGRRVYEPVIELEAPRVLVPRTSPDLLLRQ
ncbi:MAG: hypothetical protein KF858_08130 [Candidatus Sumerlaeia bacterium]|nr:hypothetical protein [Candidatus Sumerlaeia bacterium]